MDDFTPMKLHRVYDWRECRATATDIWIHDEDVKRMKKLVEDIHKCHGNMKLIRPMEHDWWAYCKQRYGGKAAGELLGKLWKMSYEREKGEEDDRE